MVYANATNISTVPGLFTFSNDASGGWFGPGLLISLYFIVLFQLLGRFEEVSDAFIVAGFFTMGTSFLLRYMGVISDWHMYVAILFTVLPVAWSYWNKDY